MAHPGQVPREPDETRLVDPRGVNPRHEQDAAARLPVRLIGPRAERAAAPRDRPHAHRADARGVPRGDAAAGAVHAGREHDERGPPSICPRPEHGEEHQAEQDEKDRERTSPQSHARS